MSNEQPNLGPIPTIFREGYEKARATDPELARAENFITLLKATELETPEIDYILPDHRHA